MGRTPTASGAIHVPRVFTPSSTKSSPSAARIGAIARALSSNALPSARFNEHDERDRDREEQTEDDADEPEERDATVAARRGDGREAHGARRFSMRGNGIVSRTCGSPQIHATVRSMPRPKPACGNEP